MPTMSVLLGGAAGALITFVFTSCRWWWRRRRLARAAAKQLAPNRVRPDRTEPCRTRSEPVFGDAGPDAIGVRAVDVRARKPQRRVDSRSDDLCKRIDQRQREAARRQS